MISKKCANVNKDCVACGACTKVCPRNSISIYKGIQARIDENKCVGCGMCMKECPANAIELRERV